MKEEGARKRQVRRVCVLVSHKRVSSHEPPSAIPLVRKHKHHSGTTVIVPTVPIFPNSSWYISTMARDKNDTIQSIRSGLAFPLVRRYISLMVSVASFVRGLPLSPPASPLLSLRRYDGRDTVVFETISPSTCRQTQNEPKEREGVRVYSIQWFSGQDKKRERGRGSGYTMVTARTGQKRERHRVSGYIYSGCCQDRTTKMRERG